MRVVVPFTVSVKLVKFYHDSSDVWNNYRHRYFLIRQIQLIFALKIIWQEFLTLYVMKVPLLQKIYNKETFNLISLKINWKHCGKK